MRTVHYAKPQDLWGVDLEEQFRSISHTGQLMNFGPWSLTLEEKLSKLCKRPACVTSSGTTALAIAMRWLAEKRSGRRLAVLPAFTFGGVAQAARLAGCDIACYDIDDDLLPCESDVSELISRSDIVLLVLSPLFGFAFPDLFRLAKTWESRVPILYDSAHFLGVTAGEEFSRGVAHAFSFSAPKIVSGAGGGALVGDEALIDFGRRARNYGMKRGICVQWGLNGKISEFDCSLLSKSVDRMQTARSYRYEIAQTYISVFASVSGVEFFPRVGRGDVPIKEMPLLLNRSLAKRRPELLGAMQAHGVECRTYFSPSLDLHETFDGASASNLVGTHNISDRIICMPLSERMSVDDVVYVRDSFLKSVAAIGRPL